MFLKVIFQTGQELLAGSPALQKPKGDNAVVDAALAVA